MSVVFKNFFRVKFIQKKNLLSFIELDSLDNSLIMDRLCSLPFDVFWICSSTKAFYLFAKRGENADAFMSVNRSLKVSIPRAVYSC